jgi:hypothetical protein
VLDRLVAMTTGGTPAGTNQATAGG